MLCGIDEAGRGPWAGPLVMAGVILHHDLPLNDSKKLSAKKREELFNQIIENSQYEIIVIEVDKIDKDGLAASLAYGLRKIKEQLQANEYIFDGNTSFGVEGIKTLIKADSQIKEVMAASILAKVARDRIMCEFDKIYPQYGFCNHKGYGTKAHKEALLCFGPTPIHRKSFRPIRSLLEER